uniref:Uncharacterized protein n=1 Tax=Oryza glumipatula TaxID=40148 RepID=A0A0D9Z0P2_9ORYZ
MRPASSTTSTACRAQVHRMARHRLLGLEVVSEEGVSRRCHTGRDLLIMSLPCSVIVKQLGGFLRVPITPGGDILHATMRICFQGIDSFTSPFFVKSGGCRFWEWCDDEAEPYMKQLLLDLRNAVWSAREQVNGLEAALRDRTVAQHNLQSTPKKESNEVQGLRAAVEKMEAANCVLVDRINKQQTCIMMLQMDQPYWVTGNQCMLWQLEIMETTKVMINNDIYFHIWNPLYLITSASKQEWWQ